MMRTSDLAELGTCVTPAGVMIRICHLAELGRSDAGWCCDEDVTLLSWVHV